MKIGTLTVAALATLAVAVVPAPTALAHYENMPLEITNAEHDTCLSALVVIPHACAHGKLEAKVQSCYFAGINDDEWTCRYEVTLTLTLDLGVCGSTENSEIPDQTPNGCFDNPITYVPQPATAVNTFPVPLDLEKRTTGYVQVKLPNGGLTRVEEWEPIIHFPPPPECEDGAEFASASGTVGVPTTVTVTSGALDVEETVTVGTGTSGAQSGGGVAFAAHVEDPTC